MEVHLAGELRFEGGSLQIDNNKTAELQMIEEKIDEEIASAYFQPILTGDEREAHAQLQKEVLQVCQQVLFQFSFPSIFAERQEIECVRVLRDLLSQIRLRRWRCPTKIRHGGSRTLVQGGLYLVDAHIAAPAVLDGCLRVPDPVLLAL
jgi:hypothetical protein